MRESYCIVTTTVDSEKIADSLAGDAIKQNLAACVQIIPGIVSHYKWQGQLDKTQELLLQFKTTENCVQKLMKYIKISHTYDTPEIIMVRIGEIDPGYGKWIESAVNSDLS